MKATCRPYLYAKRTKANGKYPVKLRVTYNRDFRFYGIGVDMTKEEFSQFHLNKKLRHLADDINFYQKKIEEIIKDLKDKFSWESFEKLYLVQPEKKEKIGSEILPAMLSYKEKLFEEERIKSGLSYECAHNALLKYVKKNNLLFSEVTTEFLKGFDKYMREKELSSSTIGIYMRNIRAIFNQAIESKAIPIESYPFGKNKYSPPSSANTKKSLKIEDIGKIFRYESTLEIEQWARDMWMFAYFGNGLNIKDIALLKNRDVLLEKIHFVREKTKNSKKEKEKKIVIILTDELKAIIERWGNKNKGPNEYLFEILEKNGSAVRKYNDVQNAIGIINKYIKNIALNLKLDRIPTTNFARHSYATVLKRAGFSTEIIGEQLGHANIRTTEIYLDSFENEQLMETTKFLTAF